MTVGDVVPNAMYICRENTVGEKKGMEVGKPKPAHRAKTVESGRSRRNREDNQALIHN